MKHFVENIFLDDFLVAQEDVTERIEQLVAEKINQLQTRLEEELFGSLDEGNIQRMGRMKLIRVRIRKGKVQRRIKKSAVPGYTVRGGRLIRMTPMERRHRKMAARRAKFKRKSKLRQAMRKRTVSIRKRKALGVR
mgnify:CR=1 FL=1